jgi:uncharacterized protein (DUF983 family)
MSIFSKGSKIYSIFNFRCPRCHEGEVFEDNNPYKLSKLFKMHQNCAHCGLRYELEPSFFFGSMYVSYGYSVALFVATYILMNLFFEPSIKQIIAVLLAVVILLAPLVLRLARITWLNIFVPYDPNKKGARHK